MRAWFTGADRGRHSKNISKVRLPRLVDSEQAAVILRPVELGLKATTMFCGTHDRRRMSLVAIPRLILPLAAIVIAFSASSADAGIVTSMSLGNGGMSASATDAGDHCPQPQSWLSFLRELEQPGLYGLAQHTNTTGTTSSPTSSSSSGSSTSALADSSVTLVCGLPRLGWVVPEAVQALPPLLPSGLFRPPCA